MTTNQPIPPPRRRDPLSPALLLAALVAVGIGLVAPLLLGSFSETQAVVLVAIEAACLAAIAAGIIVLVRRLRASHEALWALARRDELTGVGNYRALHERLRGEIARHERRRREFALILLDLDGFKQVNERFGHLEGDRLLAEIGAAMADEVRAEDSVFRQGGDEFAVIVPEAGPAQATEVAARLRHRVSRRGFGNDDAYPVGAATGFALYPTDGTTAEDLLGFADLDLYGAKRKRPGGDSISSTR